MNFLTRGLCCIALMGSLSACTHVAAYEREDLARTSMDVAREASSTAFRSHVHESREGSTGGFGAAGGGCGCN